MSSDTSLMQHFSSKVNSSKFDVNNEVKLTFQKMARQPSNSLNITNLTPKNRILFSPIMFLLLCTPFKMPASAIYLNHTITHEFLQQCLSHACCFLQPSHVTPPIYVPTFYHTFQLMVF